jgi:peptidoglycan/xylan/chitin deacetylase (PgdA/CDA1 family)
MRRILAAGACAALAFVVFLLAEPLLRPSVVVLMFHRTPDFEPVAAWLDRHGCRTLGTRELHAFLRGQLRVPPRTVMLTFDDGDATNYLGAAESMRDHRLRGVFFVLPDRLGPGAPRRLPPRPGEPVAPADSVRDAPAQADMWAALHPGRPDPWSLRWSETRLLAGGCGEIGSHTASHRFSFRSDSLQGFLERPTWHEADALGGDARRGMPRYPGGPALLGPAWRPAPGMLEALARAAARHPAGLPVDSLRGVVRTFEAAGLAGRYETREEFQARLARELAGSRARLQDSLGRTVTALAWPWGRYDRGLRERARAAGYTLIFTVETGACVRGSDSLAVPRVAAVSDTAWLRRALWLFSHPTLGRIYGRLHPPRYPT